MRCAFIVNNPGEGRMHLQGALNIAKAIGGFHKLDELGLEAALLWDIHLACLTGQKPTISDDEVAYVVEKMLPQVPEWLEDSRLRFENLLGASLISDDNSDVCGALRRLFIATELLNSYSIRKEDNINETLVIRTLFAGHKLSHCDPTTNSPNIAAEHNIRMLESMRLTGMLVIFTTHLKATRKKDLFEELSKSLEVQLRSSAPALETCWGQYLEIMMWIFFVGAHGSPNVRRILWFIENIHRGAHILGINNWMQARIILKRFPYITKEFDKAFEDTWNSSHLGALKQTSI
ncbi:hypothetical protein LTR84_003602 [Exophiala bonariae]|uniref:Uncharacterized protein n=1 Tax=Exophiala bonariae TaxID=1690606 RepID=A0AAV9N8M8_9EURO|nr:hypothetical protein LTR84_003602 [Exophiala bonariae]